MGIGRCVAVLRSTQRLADSGAVAEMNDSELLARFAGRCEGSAEIAFEALVRRHGSMVLRVCQQILGDRHTAEDAFQATFLILARRAGSIRQPELLGPWLYGVALRTAREARGRDDRRRQRESSIAEWIGGEPMDETHRPELSLVGREEREVLHEEVSRLPERYRVPVVLCELEGLTYQEAAHRLHCPVSTIGVRLRRARERLRQRLTKRGLAPMTGLVFGLFGADVASAWVPFVLVESTVQAAIGVAAMNTAATGLVPASVVAITDAVLMSMALVRIKVAASIVLAIGIGITATVALVAARRDRWLPAAFEQTEPYTAAQAVAPENPAASLLAARPVFRLVPEGHQEVAGSRSEAAIEFQQKLDEIVKTLHILRLKPETRLAQLGAVRSPRDEPARGDLLFAKDWVTNDPMSHGGDGLGPVYNETSCVACHGLGAPGGAGPESKNVILVTATTTGRGSAKALEQIHPGFHGTRSVVLHRYGTNPEYQSWRRRLYESNRESEPDSVSKPAENPINDRIQALKGQTAPDRRLRERAINVQPPKGFTLSISERNTPALFGAGRIDAIPSAVLVALAESQPAAVRGRFTRTREGRIGRFGWKAQIASLHEFVRAACANEMGLEVPGHSQAISPVEPDRKAKGFDMNESDCDALVAYVRALPAPVVVDPFGPRGTEDMRQGRQLFAQVGCTACHTPILGDVRGIYSDLLLHDMGPTLSDSGSYYGPEDPDSPGGPSPREWRTPPLWGYRDSGPYLHDGRAQNLEEAIALHEGQATRSAHRFFALSSRQRAQIETFLKSLVAPSAASLPGVVLASEMESLIDNPEDPATPENIVRNGRERALARDEQRWREDQRRARAQQAAKRAKVQLPLAQALEKMDKITGALNYYREIAREAPDTVEGRLAISRITALTARTGSP